MKTIRSWRCLAFLEMMINISWFLVVEQNKIFNLFCKKWSLHGIAYLLWTFSHVSEVCFASLISWGHLLVPCKSKQHHLFSRLCHFIALKFEPHHLPSKWCHFTSCLWNLDNVNFLQNDDRLYIQSQCCIISPLWACSCNVEFLVACSDIFKVLAPCSGIFKVLIGTPCIFNVLLASLKSWCLAIVLCILDVWAMLPLNIGATSMRVQVLILSVDVASWQRWMMTRLWYEWSVDMVSWQRWVLAWPQCK